MKKQQTDRHKLELRLTWQSICIIALVVMLISFLYMFMYPRFASPSIPDMGLDSPRGILTLTSSWTKGNVIVLIRHMERCDRSATPCLDALDGITIRGKDVAVALGNAFEKFGVQSADILTSPATRVKQTAMYMFKPAVVEQKWLSRCKTITPKEIFQHKTEGRNLILVTHYQCIEKIQKDIGVSSGKDPAYGSLMFISVDGKNNTPIAVGNIEAEQFITNLSKVKCPANCPDHDNSIPAIRPDQLTDPLQRQTAD